MGSEEAVKHGITHPLHAPSFPRGGNATSYFSRRERMEMEAEMNATVTVVLGSLRSFAFLISATVFFSSRDRTYASLFFSFIDPREWLTRKKERRKKGGGTKERKIFARMLWAWVPKSVSNVVIKP